ncbi:MAG: hypothetical protein ACOX2H_03355 [Saccharofermentanales bacterium]|jgi:hypothetical protein
MARRKTQNSFTVSIPEMHLNEETLQKLEQILKSKGALIQKALGVDRPDIEYKDEAYHFQLV